MKIFIKENFNQLNEESKILLMRNYCVAKRMYETKPVWELGRAIQTNNLTNEVILSFYTYLKESFYCAYKYNNMKNKICRIDDEKYDELKKLGCSRMGYFNPFIYLVDLCNQYPSKADDIYKIILWILVKIKNEIPEIDIYKLYYLSKALQEGKIHAITGEIYPLTPLNLKIHLFYRIKTNPENTSALNYSYEYNPVLNDVKIKYDIQK